MLIKVEGAAPFFILDQKHRRHEVKPFSFGYDEEPWVKMSGGFDCQRLKLKAGCYAPEDARSQRFFVYEQYEDYQRYCLCANRPFLYAADRRSTILSKDPYLKNSYLLYKDGSLQSNGAAIFRNGSSYQGEELVNGDEIWFMTFHFFYYEDFLYLATFNNEIRLPPFKLNVIEHLPPFRAAAGESLGYRLKAELKLLELQEFKAPPVQRQRNLLLQIAPSFTMSLTMLTVAVNNLLVNPQAQPIYLLMPGVMLISTILWPFLNHLVEKRQAQQEYCQLRKEYLEKLKREAAEFHQRYCQYRAYLQEYCLFEPSGGGFQRDSADAYFNCLYLGEGKVPFVLKKISCPDQKITEELGQLSYRYNEINNFPHFLDLKCHKRVTIVVAEKLKLSLFENLLYQLAAAHRFKDLSLAVFSLEQQDFRKFAGLEHLFNDNRRLSFCRAQELTELNELYPKPLVLFLNANPGAIDLKEHVSMIYLSTDRADLLANSSTVLEYRQGVFNNLSSGEQGLRLPLFELRAADFAALALHVNKTSLGQLMFSDFLKADTIEKNYQRKPQALISSFAFDDNGLLAFDLHERGNGPHGLIAGSTGSGKSELIVSLLLGLCINYPPDYLQLILVDYKGGGLRESLCVRGEALPHIIAAITNLENDTFERLIVQIRQLTRERQRQFGTLSKALGIPIMNIDDYLAADFQSCGLGKMAHLLIVVDEFAELKKENPEVIRELISFARIGRSLGLHLLLATQRPSGVIDEEIWSNSRFKLALKVFSKKDSRDVLHDECAASLKEPGDFFLSYDGKLLRAHSIYAKRDLSEYHPRGIALLDERLRIVQRKMKKKPLGIREAEWLCAQILAACAKRSYCLNKMCLTRPKAQNFSDEAVYGLVDDYLRAEVYPLEIVFEQHLLIYSTRKRELWGLLRLLGAKPLVLVSKEYYPGIGDNVLLNDEDALTYLFYFLAHFEQEVYLVVEDAGALLAHEGLAAKLYELLAVKERLHLYCLAKKADLPYRFLQLFKQKLAIEVTDRNDILNFFGTTCAYRGSSFVFKEEVLPFVPHLLGEETLTNVGGLLRKRPAHCKLEVASERYLIGIDLLTLEEIWLPLNESVLISSFSAELLAKYAELLPWAKLSVYQQSLLVQEADTYIWLGEGQNSQRLFYVDSKKPLKEKEAWLFRRGLLKRILLVDE